MRTYDWLLKFLVEVLYVESRKARNILFHFQNEGKDCFSGDWEGRIEICNESLRFKLITQLLIFYAQRYPEIQEFRL